MRGPFRGTTINANQHGRQAVSKAMAADTPDEDTSGNAASEKGKHLSASAIISTPQDGHCPLLALPAELRNRIYEFAIVESTPIDMVMRKRTGSDAQPGLTRTCRQIRQETLQMFFQDNVFRFDCDNDLDTEQQGILSACASYLPMIKIIQLAVCSQGDYYELTTVKGLAHYGLEIPEREEKSACDVVNPQGLDKGRDMLNTMIAPQGETAVLTADILRQLITELHAAAP